MTGERVPTVPPTTPPPTTPPPTTRRADPARRDRIIDACLELIAETGVAGTSHRKVAARANVPLGSMTYHFTGMDELLRAAFTRFSDGVVAVFETRLAAAGTVEEARAAVVGIIDDDLLASPHELVLTHELYALAARNPEYRQITHRWMRRSRAALQRHFSPDTAAQLDALIEGLSIHRALDTEPRDPRQTVDAVARITGGSAAGSAAGVSG